MRALLTQIKGDVAELWIEEVFKGGKIYFLHFEKYILRFLKVGKYILVVEPQRQPLAGSQSKLMKLN